jgi:CelD/BcsL family acetyltransferase involved in cellulose biosynthesis
MTPALVTELDGLEEPWKALGARTDNIFSTWEWASCWWRHFSRGRQLRVGLIDGSAGQPMVLLPLCAERRRGVSFTAFIGHGIADQLGPVCAPEDVPPADALLAGGAGDVLLAERLGDGYDWPALGGCVLRSEASPAIVRPAGGGFEDYLQDRSANFRQQVRRRARRLTQKLGIRFRLAQEPQRLGSDMDALFAMHAARWGESSRAFTGPRESFHREFAARALEQGWLRLWFAETDGTPVAAWYGFRFGEAEYFYQSGRDPAWDREQIGAGLLEHSIREAFEDGMREYRLLRGDESYKRRYATEIRNVLTIAVPLTQRGRGVVALARSLSKTGRGRALLRAATSAPAVARREALATSRPG